MADIKYCSLVIKDDFKNVLVLKNKVKRGQEESWSILSLKKRAKETDDKCVNRLVKDALKSIIFDLEKINEYDYNDDVYLIYGGSLKERIVLDSKTYSASKWISKNELDNVPLDDLSKKILVQYFE